MPSPPSQPKQLAAPITTLSPSKAFAIAISHQPQCSCNWLELSAFWTMRVYPTANKKTVPRLQMLRRTSPASPCPCHATLPSLSAYSQAPKRYPAPALPHPSLAMCPSPPLPSLVVPGLFAHVPPTLAALSYPSSQTFVGCVNTPTPWYVVAR
ncbi:hypothetical protein BD779DRAFT_1684657 [Infundibulicybe gibba]|nr:hypothetical protein BD779DRAFT_1684657 [Infundibulicybe gibba]